MERRARDHRLRGRAAKARMCFPLHTTGAWAQHALHSLLPCPSRFDDVSFFVPAFSTVSFSGLSITS